MGKNLFEEYDDPSYWDDGDVDRRDGLGVIISYRDIKALSEHLTAETIEKLLSRMDHWGYPVQNFL